MMDNKNVLIFGTVLRLVISLAWNASPSNKFMMYGTKSIEAILIDPMYSLSRFRETCHLSRLYVDGILHLNHGFVTSNNIPAAMAKFIVQPVSLYAFVDRIFQQLGGLAALTIIPSTLIFGIVAILIDLVTVIQIFRLAKNLTAISTNDKLWEQRLEQKMNPLIHPVFAWVFGEKFGDNFQKVELENPSLDTEAETTTIPKGNGSNNAIVSDDKSSTTKKVEVYTHHNDHNKVDNDERKHKQEQNTSPPVFKLSDIPQLCTIVYYLNPITILSTSIFPSFQGVQYLLLATIFQQITSTASDKSEKRELSQLRALLVSTFLLALLTQFEFYYVIFLVPLFFWCTRNFVGGINHQLIGYGACAISSYILLFVGIKMILLFFSVISIHDGTFSQSLSSILPHILNVGRSHDSLSPSIGLQWYLFMNMFGRSRQFFVVSTKSFPFLFAIPFSIRFYRYPIAMVAMFHLLLTLLKQSPTLHDMSFGLTLLLLEPKSLMRMGKSAFVCVFAIPVTFVLFVVDYWSWLESGTGNPNFLFFQCVAYELFLGTIVISFISCTMKRDKALRLTEGKHHKLIKKVKSS